MNNIWRSLRIPAHLLEQRKISHNSIGTFAILVV
jgi:hypothetical protein